MASSGHDINLITNETHKQPLNQTVFTTWNKQIYCPTEPNVQIVQHCMLRQQVPLAGELPETLTMSQQQHNRARESTSPVLADTCQNAG
jgi:hypothetical protein